MIGTVLARGVACGLSILVLLPAAAWSAEDRPLIWSPSRTGINAYALKMGARFGQRWSAGTEVSIAATTAGRVQEPPPVGLWGRFSRKNGTDTARSLSQDVDIKFDAPSGTGTVGLSSTRRWIATRRLDVVSQRSVSLQCTAYDHHCGSARLSQSMRIVAAGTGTAIVAQGGINDGRLRALDRLGIEQTLGRLSIGAAISNPVSKPLGSITARYALNW